MKRMILATYAALSLGSAWALPVNLLTNGDFEANDADVADGGYTTVGGGNPLIAGWTVGGNSVDLIQNNYGAITNVSIDLAGSPGPGSLSQSFAVVAGTTYELAFDYFRNGDGTNLTVGFGDLGSIVLAPAGSTVLHATYQWTATATGTASVSFLGGDGNFGPTLDNVSVVALANHVPEPHTAALVLLALGGMAAARRRAAC